MKKKIPITIKILARKLDISKSTVSRALRGQKDVKPETKEAVLNLAKELNYKPNYFAYSLANNKSFSIGVAVPNIAFDYFSIVVSGISAAAHDAGFRILVSLTNDEYEREVEDMNVFLSSRVDGLLVAPANDSHVFDHFKIFNEKDVPIVFFDRFCEGVDASMVTVDDYGGARKAVEHLIDIGCKDIVHLAGTKHVSVAKSRAQGYYNTLRSHNLPISEENVFHVDFQETKTIEAVKQILLRDKLPDAIFCVNDLVAIAAMDVLKTGGIRIPEDIAIIGFADLPYAKCVSPSLSTVSQPAFELGKTAFNLLNELFKMKDNQEELKHRKVVLQTELVIRESTQRKS